MCPPAFCSQNFPTFNRKHVEGGDPTDAEINLNIFGTKTAWKQTKTRNTESCSLYKRFH
jgi:hypothetical protein